MFNQTHQLNRRRFLGGTAAVVGATMLPSVIKTKAHAASVPARSGSLLIDDFASGPYLPGPLYDGPPNKYVVPGSMLGGHRYTNLHIARNDRNQPVNLDTGTGYLNFSAGIDAYYRITVGYGFQKDGDTIGTFPLLENLSECNALHFRFAPVCLQGTLHVTMWSAGGARTAWPHPDRPHLAVIEKNETAWTHICSLSDFSEQFGSFNLAEVHQIVFIIQAVGQFALEKVETV